MKIFIEVLCMLALLSLFAKAKLGVMGLLILAIVIWNFVGSIIEYSKTRP